MLSTPLISDLLEKSTISPMNKLVHVTSVANQVWPHLRSFRMAMMTSAGKEREKYHMARGELKVE